MGMIIRPNFHVRASAGARAGRTTPDGHGPSGQLSENHCIARSSRRTWMSAPPSIADSFLPSSKARELTVERPTPSMSAYARATASNCSIESMLPISVNLPDKSTAILPDAMAVGSGHLTEMTETDWTAVLSNIEARLKTLRMSPHAASKRAGHLDAIRNLERSIERGKPGMSLKTLDHLAVVLKTSREALLSSGRVHLPKIEPEQATTAVEMLKAQRSLLDQQISTLEEAACPAKRRRRS